MLPPHPLLRTSDLRGPASTPNLPRLIAEAGVRRFYNARAALYQLARALRASGRSSILLPAFHCPSVVEPVLRAGMRPVFYRIDRSMEVDASDVLARLDGDVAAAVFINYLGFPSRFEPLLAELRARGILAIEDCAHACVSVDPLELAGRRADAAVYSFWKLVPSGVGGGLWLSPDAALEFPALGRAPLRDSAVRAKNLFEELVAGLGDDSLVAQAYDRIERARVRAKSILASRGRPPVEGTRPPVEADLAPQEESREYFFDPRLAESRLPWMAEQIMARADLREIVGARRRNYLALAGELHPPAMFEAVLPALPARISPLAYPVALRDRSTHDVLLRARGVPVWTFGSTLHRVLFETADPAVAADARHLSDTLLLVPVHQMLTEAQMTVFADTINRYAMESAACTSN